MGKVWSAVLLTLMMSLVLATSAVARPVYLNDGSIVEAQKVWRAKGKVYILVNRDVLLTFAPEEVNVKKTFGKKRVKLKRKVQAEAVKPAAAPGNGDSQAKDKPAPTAASDKPAAPSAHAKPGAATPAAKPGAPAAAGTIAAAAKPGATTGAGATTPTAKPAGPEPAANPGASAAKPAPAKPAEQPKPPVPSMPPPVAQVGAGNLIAAGLPMLIVGLILFLVVIVSFWKVFVKAGQAGWKSLIPIYNLIVLIQIAGKPLWWLLLFLVPIVNIVFLVLLHIELAKRFGKGAVFGLGLCFLGFVFFPILAFDNSTYS